VNREPQEIISWSSPVYHIKLMQVFESEEELRAIKSATLLVESLLPLQMMEEFAAIDKTRTHDVS
jgi:hypothetical protein